MMQSWHTDQFIILPDSGPQGFNDSLQIILLFFHILDSLVAFSEEALQTADFSQ